MLPKYVFPIALGFYISGVFAGLCFSSIRDPDSDATTPDTSPYPPCANPVPAGGWACAAPSVTFPTVECIIADLRSCGIFGTGPTVFYSFGAETTQVRAGFRNKLNPPGVMFNDALGDEWWLGPKSVPLQRLDFRLDDANRMVYFRNLFSVAMAQASVGEVFIVVKSRTSEATPPGLPGASQNPKTSPNLWRDFEFPTVQRNAAIT